MNVGMFIKKLRSLQTHISLYVCVFAFFLYFPTTINAQTITQTTQLQFGQLAKPASGSHNFTLNTTNGTSGTGVLLSGTPLSGVYQITRGSFGPGTVTINVNNINSGNANLTLGSFTGDWGGTAIASFPRSGLSRPAGGPGTTLRLGATVTYTSSIPVGTITPSFDIVIVQP
jgi:hypothetical protein